MFWRNVATDKFFGYLGNGIEYYYPGGGPLLLEDCNKKLAQIRICKFRMVENQLDSYTKKKADLK